MTLKCPKEANLEPGTPQSDPVVALAIDDQPMAKSGHIQFRAHDDIGLFNIDFRCIVFFLGNWTWHFPITKSNTDGGNGSLGCDDWSVAV